MRRLLAVTGSVVFVDAALYSALTPLLPGYAEEFGLSKAAAGVLVGAYAAGALVGGLPGGVAAARFGPRTAAIAGLLVVGLASVAFGVADNAWALGAARFAQGLGSAFSWSGALAWLVAASPRERRGELLGSALGAAIAGAMLGPAVGAAAELAGDTVTFAAVAVLAGGLALVASRMPGPPPEAVRLSVLGDALRDPRLVGGLWLVTLPSLLFGLLAVLAPLELAELGWGALAIGALWLATAGVEAGMNPLLGRLVDRRGRLLPVRVVLVAAVAVSVALAWADSAMLVAALVVATALAWGGLFTPGMAIISDSAERAGVVQAVAFGVMNAAWAVGNIVGPAAGGAVAGALGDAVAFASAAAVCAATFAAVSLYARGAPRRLTVPT